MGCQVIRATEIIHSQQEIITQLMEDKLKTTTNMLDRELRSSRLDHLEEQILEVNLLANELIEMKDLIENTQKRLDRILEYVSIKRGDDPTE